ncbi:MAG: FtsX-like permease family protein, partial [Chloracidobacterium sp.]|nr:FtsX-like permease family protein [Chloracidobacterium sp.]
MNTLDACTNIANLMLARAASRRKEIGMRLCMGASRRRVIRQLLTESLLLDLLGGVAGLFLAWWSLETGAAAAVVGVAGPSLNLTPDPRILAATLLLSLASGVAFGLLPALQATRADLIATIKNESSATGQRLSHSLSRVSRRRASSLPFQGAETFCYAASPTRLSAELDPPP